MHWIIFKRAAMTESSGLSIILGSVNPITRLYDYVKKYRKKKRIEDKLAHAFENEIKEYIDNLKSISELSESRLMPIVESIGDTFTPHDMNRLLEAMIPLPLMISEQIYAFIDFAKACSEITFQKGLMDDLKETDPTLYDFVFIMKNTYAEKNKVKIDGAYYRFFKTHEDELMEDFEIDNLDQTINKFRRYMNKLKQYMKNTAMIKRDLKKKFRRNFQNLLKASENLEIEPAIIDMRAYVPRKLLPFVVMLEEYMQ
jgi:hypothetical protein